MQRNLIINADDFGMSREVNEGTKKGIKAGIITSVSLLANMPYFDDAVLFLKKYPNISVGLHFNITEGKSLILPKYAGNLLREDDNFYYWPQLLTRIAVNNIDLDSIKAELIAQYTRLNKTGLKISHIDSHHHVHLYPSIFKIVSAWADKEKISSLRAHRFSAWNLTLGTWKKPILTQVLVNAFLVWDNLSNRNYKHLYKIDRFYDINWGRNMSSQEFSQILNNLPSGTTEFICHLALLSETGNQRFLNPRYQALNLLTHPTIKKELIQNGITLKPHTQSNGTLKKAKH